MTDNLVKENERVDDLQFHGMRIIQRADAFRFGTDAVLLGAWADLRGCKRILDVGCGSGVIALMAAQRTPEACITGVEIDEEAVHDAQRTYDPARCTGCSR